MVRFPIAAWFVGVVTALFAMGCGNQPGRVLLPHDAGKVTSSMLESKLAATDGPRLCFFDEFFKYCYPGPGYCPCPSAEIPVEVGAGRPVTMNWLAQPSPGLEIRWFRWALDIDDVSDETPRIDEKTDLSHWSVRSADGRSAQLGPWSNGEIHRLYVEVEDSFGFRSLGIVRFEVGKIANRPPECGNARANPAQVWPPNHHFVPVNITGVTDPDGDPVSISVLQVTQDEPVQNCPDAVIGTNGRVELRAERSGHGNGRVYVISFTATDPSGATCNGSVEVCVPHDQGHRACIDDGQNFSSTGPCTPSGRGPKLTSPIESRADLRDN